MDTTTRPGQWDFGLDDEQEARAARLHEECLIADLVHQHPGGANIFKTYDPRLLKQALGDVGEGLSGVGQAIAASARSLRCKRWFRLPGSRKCDRTARRPAALRRSGPARPFAPRS